MSAIPATEDHLSATVVGLVRLLGRQAHPVAAAREMPASAFLDLTLGAVAPEARAWMCEGIARGLTNVIGSALSDPTLRPALAAHLTAWADALQADTDAQPTAQ